MSRFFILNLSFCLKERDRAHKTSPLPATAVPAQGIHRSDSTTEFHPTGEDIEVEYFFASDARQVYREL